jgi:putative tryptophan/tyrosine transport system substrate-binding protein
VKRRTFIAALGSAVAWPLLASATEMRPRIVFLSLDSQEDGGPFSAFTEALSGLGYVASQNIDIDYRYAAGDTKLLMPLAQELVALKPDVSIAGELSSARALKRAAPMLPIVCPTLTDALIPDLAASYARPGGTVTGIAQSVEGVTGKLLELAIEMIPEMRRVGFLSNPAGASMPLFARSIADGARAHGIAVVTEEGRTPDELDRALDRLAEQQVQAVLVPVNGLFITQRARIVQVALAARLPTVFAQRKDVVVGGLASYGVDQLESFRRAAAFVDKILKGAKPGELPIEFPTRLELVVNLRTAKSLGITLPPTLLGRADEVIE